MKHRILIACPSKSGVSAHWFEQHAIIMRADHPDFTFEFIVVGGHCAVNMARNIIADTAIENHFWAVIQIDADMKWNAEQVVRIAEDLLVHPIVYAPYIKKESGPAKWLVVRTPGAEIDPVTHLLECDFVGTGLLATRVEALRAICAACPEQRFTHDDEQTGTPREMTELFPIGLVGPNTAGGRWRRLMAVFEKHSDPNFTDYNAVMGEIADIIQRPHPSQSRLLGEDYFFPVSPSTQVLGSDWRWKPLNDFSVGETIISVDETSAPNSSRRMQVSVIDGVVKRMLPEFRIVTEGREFRTTAEHPWLSISCRKDIKKSKWDWRRTDLLSPGDVVARVVPVEKNPDTSSLEYMAGYVQGLLQSDGHHAKNGSFIVRMCDTEPLERFATFLANLGVESTRKTARWDGNMNHRVTHGVGVYRKSSKEKLLEIASVESIPSKSFASGYLAGMYDGDGCYNGGQLFIAQKKDWKKDRIDRAGRMLGIEFGRSPVSSHFCGTDNAYKFWMLTSPCMSRRMVPLGQMPNTGRIRKGHEVHHRPEKVLSVERTGRTVDMWCPTTSSGTFIADGIASHNCHLARRAGFKLYCDMKFTIGHVGEVVYPILPHQLSEPTNIPTHDLDRRHY